MTVRQRVAGVRAELYETKKLSSRDIAVVTGVPERTIRDRLLRYGIRIRSRGGWNREDRRTLPEGELRELYGSWA